MLTHVYMRDDKVETYYREMKTHIAEIESSLHFTHIAKNRKKNAFPYRPAALMNNISCVFISGHVLWCMQRKTMARIDFATFEAVSRRCYDSIQQFRCRHHGSSYAIICTILRWALNSISVWYIYIINTLWQTFQRLHLRCACLFSMRCHTETWIDARMPMTSIKLF